MTPTHLFTADQANRMLPLVRRIVADIVDHYRRWEDLVDAFEIAAADSRADRQSAEAERLQREAQRTAEDIEGFRRELAALGVECKAFDVGLVDFPAEIAGRPAYLC